MFLFVIRLVSDRIYDFQERGILKEANLDRRIQPVVSLKETAAVIGFSGGILHKKHGNDVQVGFLLVKFEKISYICHLMNNSQPRYLVFDPRERRSASNKVNAIMIRMKAVETN